MADLSHASLSIVQLVSRGKGIHVLLFLVHEVCTVAVPITVEGEKEQVDHYSSRVLGIETEMYLWGNGAFVDHVACAINVCLQEAYGSEIQL